MKIVVEGLFFEGERVKKKDLVLLQIPSAVKVHRLIQHIF